MNPELDIDIDAVEAFEQLTVSNSGRSKSSLKSSLDMNKLMTTRTATFEVEEEDNLTLDVDEDMPTGLDVDSYFATYFNEKTQKAISKNPETIKALISSDFISSSFASMKENMTSIHGNQLVLKQVFKQGKGQIVSSMPKCKLLIHYILVSEGADEPFDSTVLRNTPNLIDLAEASLIPGLYVAICSMEVGEVSKFIIDSSLAFGELGCSPRVPPGADVMAIVEVLQVFSEEFLQSPLLMTADQRAKLQFDQIVKLGDDLRTSGNGFYMNDNYWPAIKRYRRAASILEDYPVISEVDETARCSLLHTLYANLAQCYLKLNRPAQACTACKLGLRTSKGKDQTKLFYRFARAKFELKHEEQALDLCKQALRLDPNNHSVKALQKEITCELSKQEKDCEKMYKGIFNKQ